MYPLGLGSYSVGGVGQWAVSPSSQLIHEAQKANPRVDGGSKQRFAARAEV